MSSAIRLCFIAVLCVAICNAADLVVGTTANATLIYSESVKLSSIPLKTRTKNVFHNTDNSTRIIKGISAVDLDKTPARASVTSGGVGSTFVNVRLKSNRGDGLNYLVQIYV